jgi:LDH2 family malate/lactate/ureidoglycolate dehydrogenase
MFTSKEMFTSKDVVTVNHEKLRQLTQRILCELGVPEKDAKTASYVLNESDLRGIDSHGMGRLKAYAKALRLGLINKAAEIKIVTDAGSILLIDGCNSLGIVTTPHIMQMCIDRARKAGVCVIGVVNTNHFGIAGYYPMMAAKQGMLGICFANTLPLAAPFGGKDRLIGSDPIGIAAPAGQYDDFVLDMATSSVAYGKLEIAMRRGDKIPTDWIIGPKGEVTDDPHDFGRGGALRSMAGPKGYGLSVMIEVFSSLLVGAGIGHEVGNAVLDEKRENIGIFMLAIDISKIRPLEDFKAHVDKYYEMVKGSGKAQGVKEIFLPGEIEAKITRQRMEKGIPLNEVVARDVLVVAESVGLCEEGETFEDLLARCGIGV